MIKYPFILLALCSFLFACGSDTTEEVDENEESLVETITISGTIEGAANQVLYLEAQSPNGTISIGNSKIGADGSFKMKGSIPGLGVYQFRLGDAPNNMLLLTLQPNDHLKIKATAETFASTPTASGTDWSTNLTDYMKELTEFRMKQEELNKKKDQFKPEDLMAQFLIMKAKIDAFAMDRMLKDPGNPFNIILTTYAVPSTSFDDWDPAFLDVLKTVASAYETKFKDSPMTENLSKQVYEIEVAYDEHLANNAGTRVAPEIALKNPSGQEMRLSSLRGKYVLIDFWASWCAPCRQESPNVVRLYNKYKDKGFTVYSVSLDANAEAWKAAIVKDGLNWPNHVSDLLEWKSPMPQLYGFNSIPHTVLLNKEGKIIGTGLRGAALEQKLKEIFEN